MTTPNAPRKRASNAERERISQLLHDAHVDGQLTLTEFDDRTKALWAAIYADELPALVADLSPAPAPVPATHVTSGTAGSALSFSIMGGSERRGDWSVAPTHTSITVMGGNSLDLREARLGAHETVINAVAVMGGIAIIVPEDVRVIDNGMGIMGGFGIKDHPSCGLSSADVPDEAPVVRVRGLALMGGVGIIRAARDAEVR